MGRFVPVLLLTLAAISLRAQNEPTSRPAANIVRVDMYATVDGRPVEDLTSAEVEVLEDGVPQTIASFEHVNIPGAGVRESGRDGQPAPSARGRVFVIFLDTYNTEIESSSTLRLPLIKFLDQLIAADDIVAVVTPEAPVGQITFGRKTTVISNIMQSDWAWARGGRTDSRDPKETLYDACYPAVGNAQTPAAEMKARRREKLALDALDNLVERLADAREERKAILTISDGWVLFKANEALRTSSGRDQSNLVGRLLRRPPEKTEEAAGSKEVNRVECDADRVTLAALDHTLRLRPLVENANRANMTFYPLSARGLASGVSGTTSGARNREANLESRQDSLRFLADGTDGLAVGSSGTPDASITRIVSDLSSYYLIGYVSSNTRLDGRFRTVAVRVKRDGVKVRARRGYRGSTADELVSGTSGSASIGGPGAAPTAFNARAPFRIRTSSWLRNVTDESARGGAFWIVGELDYQTRRQLAWTAGSEAEVVVLAADGTEVVSRTVSLNAEEGPFSIQVPDAGTIAPGEYAVRVRLRSQADAKVEVSDTARVVLNQSSALGEAVMWRRGLSTGPQYLRTADPRFMRSDRLRLELATSTEEPASARILDRKGSALSVPALVSERPDSSGSFHWIVIDAPLAPFAPGDYTVEVTQGGDKRLTDFKLVP